MESKPAQQGSSKAASSTPRGDDEVPPLIPVAENSKEGMDSAGGSSPKAKSAKASEFTLARDDTTPSTHPSNVH